MKYLKWLGHLVMFILLTLITQIGGVVYALSLFLFKKGKKQVLFFVFLYSLSSFLIIPKLAPFFGRIPVEVYHGIKVHAFFTRIANRHYVVPELNDVLQETSVAMQEFDYDFEIHILDANFPFFDGFPLLPHLSHNDGKKVDISLHYTTADGEITNAKPSRSGYGVFTAPEQGEYDQINSCIEKGYWQYDFPKYLTFGVPNDTLVFDEEATKQLVQTILQNRNIGKVFIEPHLRNRLGIRHGKLRFHGCQAVRHDDHIHLQLK